MLTMPQIDVVLRGGFLVALDEVGLARRRALKRALAEQVVHERADVQPDLRPERLVVGLEDHPLRAAVEALFDVKSEAAHRNVLVFVGELIGAAQRARAPDDAAVDRERAQAIDAERIELAVFSVGQGDAQVPARRSERRRARRALSRRRVRIGARHDAGDDAAGHEGVESARRAAGRPPHAGKIERGVARSSPDGAEVGQPFLASAALCPCLAPGGGRIDDQHGAPSSAQYAIAA